MSAQVAGPMWLGPIHHRPFVDKMLEIVQHPESDFHTGARLKGMLSIAQKVSAALGSARVNVR